MHIRRRDCPSRELYDFSGAGIVDDCAGKPHVGRSPGRRVDAHVAHGAADDQVGNFLFVEDVFQARFPETVWEIFLYNGFSGQWLYAGVYVGSVGFGQKESGARLDGQMPNMKHWPAFRPESGQEFPRVQAGLLRDRKSVV